MVLPLGLVAAGALEIPDAVMSGRGLDTDVEAGQPPSTHVLEDRSQGIRSFAADEVLNHDGVFATRQSGNIKLRAVRRLAAGAEDAAVETSVYAGGWSGVQPECSPDLGMSAAKGRLVVVDSAGDTIEIRLQGGDGAGTEAGHITAAG